MKFYQHPFSSNCRKVAAVIAELGLDVESQLVDLSKGEQRSPEFVAINPMSKVPALVDGDLNLWESHAIMRHLARTAGDTALYPTSNLKALADIDRWMDWSLANWTPAVGAYTFEKLFKPMLGIGTPDPAFLEQQLQRIAPLADALERFLDGCTFLAGDTLTLADYAVAVPLTFARAVELPIDDYPNVASWFGRVSESKGWQATEPRLG